MISHSRVLTESKQFNWVYKHVDGKEHPIKLRWPSAKALASSVSSEKDDVSQLTIAFYDANWGGAAARDASHKVEMEEVNVKRASDHYVEVEFVWRYMKDRDKPASKSTMKFFFDED